MKRFNYIARDKNGKKVEGKVEATGPDHAAKLLRDRGLIIIKISPERATVLSLWNKFAQHVTIADMAIFTRQFSTMVSSGLPITDALVILKAQSKPAMQPVIAGILADVEGGSSLTDALEKHKGVFSSVYIALVRAGEEGGVLDKILVRLADNLESQREFQSKVKGALIYPAVVVAGMVIVATIMMVFVIPRMTSLYQDVGAKLPTPTLVLISISSFFIHFWWLVGALLIGLIWFFVQFKATKEGRLRVDRLKLEIPIIGNLQRQIILAELARTLGLLVGAGVSILEALKIVSGVVGNVIVSDAVDKSAEDVEKGFSVAYTFSQYPEVFPPILFQMLAVGEETGKMDDSLLKVSNIFEQESEQAVKGLTAAIEPLVMIILGIGVGFLVIAVILPIYSLTNQIG